MKSSAVSRRQLLINVVYTVVFYIVLIEETQSGKHEPKIHLSNVAIENKYI